MTDMARDIDHAGEAHAPDPLAEMLVQSGLITSEQAEAVSRMSDAHGGRYDEVAVELGFITAEDLRAVLSARRGPSGLPPHASFHQDIVVIHQPQSRQAEDFRSLRNALTLRWFKKQGGARTLAVVSAERGDGRSVCAANLATCFAQAGLRTLLIDADMRFPRQHRLLGLGNHPGLANYLSGRKQESAYQTIGVPETLTVMPVSEPPANPQELLLGAPLSELIASAERNFEIILIDTPAASESNDYQPIAAASRGALVVTREKHTRVRSTARLINSCEDLGIELVGATMLPATR
jgi:receptor protein-tyrosine kinase